MMRAETDRMDEVSPFTSQITELSDVRLPVMLPATDASDSAEGNSGSVGIPAYVDGVLYRNGHQPCLMSIIPWQLLTREIRGSTGIL